jgi:hypothetical protein
MSLWQWMIEVELFFMSTASYSLHILDEMTYDMPRTQKQENSWSNTEEIGKIMVQDFKRGC